MSALRKLVPICHSLQAIIYQIQEIWSTCHHRKDHGKCLAHNRVSQLHLSAQKQRHRVGRRAGGKHNVFFLSLKASWLYWAILVSSQLDSFFVSPAMWSCIQNLSRVSEIERPHSVQVVSSLSGVHLLFWVQYGRVKSVHVHLTRLILC